MFFPMYLDVDMAVPMERLTDEALLMMAKCLNGQAQLFYPEDDSPLRLIVCDKMGDAKPAKEQPLQGPTLYKHGIHFYWPTIIVNWENCMRMRLSFIAGLEKLDWTQPLGAKEMDWNAFLDEAVYGKDTTNPHKGLRMVFAPKAERCGDCKNHSVSRMTCRTCNKQGYHYDHRYYKLAMVVKGQEVDEESTRLLRINPGKLLSETTVRSSRTDVSPGWLAYAGCPGVAPASHPSASSKPASKAFGTGFKTEVRSSTKEEVMMELLPKFSEHYKSSTIRMVVNANSMEYRVQLRGEGAQYCLNLKDFHKSQNVYMVVKPHPQKTDQFMATMKCFCRCPTLAGGRSMLCSEFESRKCVWLDQRQTKILFGDVEKPNKKRKM